MKSGNNSCNSPVQIIQKQRQDDICKPTAHQRFKEMQLLLNQMLLMNITSAQFTHIHSKLML